MKLQKKFLTILLIGLWIGPAAAQDLVAKKTGLTESTPLETKTLVIGKSLKVGMPLRDAIQLLGIPKSVAVSRGTEPMLDSIQIDYPNLGIIIHALNKKQIVEQIEVLPSFTGSFSEGLKIGAKFPELVGRYGMPKQLSSQVARYPDKGMFFVLKEDSIVSAKVFVRNSKILAHRLLSK